MIVAYLKIRNIITVVFNSSVEQFSVVFEHLAVLVELVIALKVRFSDYHDSHGFSSGS